MSKRIPLLVQHVMYNLRGGFLVRPLIIALFLGFAFVARRAARAA